MLLLLKIVLSVACTGVVLYALVALRRGRVYSKGLWYERESEHLGFWLTIGLYMLGPPAILYLAWTAS